MVGAVRLTLSRHVEDLQHRLEWPVIVLVAGTFVAYFFRSGLIDWLHAPLLQSADYGPVGASGDFQSAACLLAGVCLSIPIALWQLVAAFRPLSRRQAFKLAALSATAVAIDVTLAYNLLPWVIGGLSRIDIADFHPFILAETYLLFVINFLGVAAIVSPSRT